MAESGRFELPKPVKVYSLSKRAHSTTMRTYMAEGKGFEPLIPCGIHAFQACALDHYANLPKQSIAQKPQANLP